MNTETATKVWTKAEIKARLQSGDKNFLTRALLAVYERQTSHEKLAMATTEDNGVGFSGFDAAILTSFAEQWKNRGWLSSKQWEILSRRMVKYAGQLEIIAAEKQAKGKTYTQEASEAPVHDGLIKFQDGFKVNVIDLLPEYHDGEIVAWTANVNGNQYILIND